MINLNIVDPTTSIYSGECSHVEVKTTAGNITILENHAPLITTIENGYAVIDSDQKIEISKGLCVVEEGSKVQIIVTDLLEKGM